MLKKFISITSLSDSNVSDVEKFLTEMNLHVENSIKEAVSHSSAYSALADLMVEHPRGALKHIKLRKWAIHLISQLKELDSTLSDAMKAIELYRNHKEDREAPMELAAALTRMHKEIERYGDFSTRFANALAKEGEPLDHNDHLKVKAEVVNALLNKKHLNSVYVNNIISWF